MRVYIRTCTLIQYRDNETRLNRPIFFIQTFNRINKNQLITIKPLEKSFGVLL